MLRLGFDGIGFPPRRAARASGAIKWGRESGGEWRVLEWQALREQRCRASRAAFVDITAQAFGSNRRTAGSFFAEPITGGRCSTERRVSTYMEASVSPAGTSTTMALMISTCASRPGYPIVSTAIGAMGRSRTLRKRQVLACSTLALARCLLTLTTTVIRTSSWCE